MFIQNPWVSKCKNDIKVIYINKWCVFFACDVLMQLTFSLNLCNYCDVILNKIMQFLYETMKIEFCTNFVQTYEA
jgi:hypothetical protein